MSDVPAYHRPDHVPAPPPLADAEARIRVAIDTRAPQSLDIIGNGELSIAIAWGDGESSSVVKRVPPFPTRPAADQYSQLVRDYLRDLEAVDVRCVRTDLVTVDREDGSAVVYHCQPRLDPATLADQILRAAEPSADHPVVGAVIDATARSLAAGLPIDSQFANWCWLDEQVWQLDFSTPLMVDQRGDICFDSTGFQREYPLVVRRLVYRELMKVAPHYSELDWVLTDVMTQLYRQGLEAWCDPFAAACRERHGVDVSPAEARTRYESDLRFYPNLLRLKRAQRAWMQRTRRRYDGLLPVTTSFGR